MRELSQTLADELREVTMVHRSDDPDFCSAFLRVLPITGAAVTVISSVGLQSTVCASNWVASRIDELQFELGEGPQRQVAQTGEPVFIPDISLADHGQWPMFGSALTELPVGALFSIPMKMGAVTVGSVSLYRDRPGELNADHKASALAIASAISGPAVRSAVQSASEDAPSRPAESPSLRREVHQATGMILVQLETSATVAYSRLQAYAFAQGRTVQSVAHDVVARILVFTDES